jgi:hypothetical protein
MSGPAIFVLVDPRVHYPEATLLHEMVHASLPWRVNHGPKFQAEMLRLAKAGAFKEYW